MGLTSITSDGTVVQTGTVASGTSVALGYGQGSGITVLGGGTLAVDAYYIYVGSASDVTIDGGGVVSVAGHLVGATVEAGGTLLAGTGYFPVGLAAYSFPGVVSGAEVLSGGLFVDGGLASGGGIASGGIVLVLGGYDDGLDGGSGTGSAVAMTVDSGGLLVALPGSVVSGTVGSLTTTGLVLVAADGSVSYAATSVSGVTLGGAASAEVRLPEDALLVLSGGTAAGDTIGSGGRLIVYAGGLASGGTLAAGGTLALSGGIASGIAVAVGGFLAISSGSAVGETLASGVTEQVGGFGVFGVGSALATLVQSGGEQAVFGAASGTTVEAGGEQLVGVRSGDSSAGYNFIAEGVASGTAVRGGGAMVVSLGTAYGATIESGGAMVVSAGSAYGTQVASGGSVLLDPGAIADGTTVAGGGLLVVLPGGSASGTSGSATSTGVVVSSPASGLAALGPGAAGLALGGSAGSATLYVLADGTVTDTSIGAGATADIYAGGLAAGLSLGAGGSLRDAAGQFSGLTISGANAALSGGSVFGLGLVSGTVGLDAFRSSFAAASSASVVSDGTLGAGGTLTGTGSAVGVTVAAGGLLAVDAASGTVIGRGGTQDVTGFGSAVDTTIGSGGVASVGGSAYAGEIDAASAMQVARGGTLLVGAGGVVDGASIASSGWAMVSSGGILTFGTVDSGGTLLVLPGGSAGAITGSVISTGDVLSVAGSFLSLTWNVGAVSGGETLLLLQEGEGEGLLVTGGGLERVLGGADMGGTVAAGGVVSATRAFIEVPLVSGGSELVGIDASASAAIVEAGGVLAALSGGTLAEATVSNGGQVSVGSGGTLAGGTIGAGGTLQVALGAAVSGAVSFAGSGGTLLVGTPGDVDYGAEGALAGATISGFGAGDTIVVAGGTDISATLAIASGNLLTVPTSGQGAALQFDPAQNFSGDDVAVTPVAGGVALTLAPASVIACFRAGTRIRAERGEVAVEALRVGERVALAGGGLAPVRWLGRRRVDGRRHPRPWDVWPVRIAAEAFGPGRPGRDLFLSPDHAVLIGGHLIPVRHLLNGASIAQVAEDAVEYWHVELPAHGVLLAEGLACESFLDTGNRAAFAGGVTQLFPVFAYDVWAARACAPLVQSGPALARAKRRLLRRAEHLCGRLGDDAALAVLADGAALALTRADGICRAALPAGAKNIVLRSKTFVPAFVDPDSHDTRTLGVALGRLWLDGREASLESAALGAGWHAPEGRHRWTDGAAAIAVNGARRLAFTVAMAGRYWPGAAYLPSSSLNTSIAALNASRPAGTPA